MFKPGLHISIKGHPLGMVYGDDCYGPPVEVRKLNDIRKSLLQQDCDGPEDVYAIAMDVARPEHKDVLQQRMLLYGVVTYAAGRLGNEPVRSQGHVHKVSTHSGWSPPEVYEIWQGKAVIYMQEFAKDEPGRCFAVYANPGDTVIVPPGWAHATISADPLSPLTFGAWCDREYGFLYDDVKAHKGLAWYALLDNNNRLYWQRNTHYAAAELVEKAPGDYTALFGIEKSKPIYTQFAEDNDKFQFVSQPWLKEGAWLDYTP